MLSYSLIPFVMFLGLTATLQAGLNKRIGGFHGLANGILLNSTILFIIALFIAYIARKYPEVLPSFFHPKKSDHLSWWYVLPGIFGFFLITGLPFAMNKLGALRVFTIAVAAQMASSLAWDFLMEGHALTLKRVLGAILVSAGAALTVL